MRITQLLHLGFDAFPSSSIGWSVRRDGSGISVRDELLTLGLGFSVDVGLPPQTILATVGVSSNFTMSANGFPRTFLVGPLKELAGGILTTGQEQTTYVSLVGILTHDQFVGFVAMAGEGSSIDIVTGLPIPFRADGHSVVLRRPHGTPLFRAHHITPSVGRHVVMQGKTMDGIFQHRTGNGRWTVWNTSRILSRNGMVCVARVRCLLRDVSLLSYGQVSRPSSPRSSYREIRHGPHSRTTLSSHPPGTAPSSLAIIRGHRGPLQHPPDLRPSVGGVQGWTRGDGDLVQDEDTQCQLETFGMSEIRHHDPSSHRGKLRSSCRTSTSPLSPSGMLSFHAMVEKDIEIPRRL